MINDSLVKLFGTEEGTKDFTTWLQKNRTQTESKNIIQTVVDFIKDLCDAIRTYIAEHQLTKAENRELRMEEAFAKQLRQQFLEALDSAIENYQKVEVDANAEGKMRYSLMVFEKDGRRFVEIDQEQERFKGHDRSEYPRIAKNIINEKFNGKVVGIDNQMFVNGQGRDEYANPSKYIEGDVYEAKMRAAGELDNLLDAGTNFRNEPDGKDGHIHKDVIGGFDYFDTLFKIGNDYYEATINIKNIKRGKLFKDVTKIKDVTQDIMSSYGKNPKSQFLRTSSMNSISETDKNTTEKVRKSLKVDTKGYDLTEAEKLFSQEYDEWDKKDFRKTFTLTTTSKALKEIGIKEKNITMDGVKIL